MSYRNRVTSAPALVNGVIDTTNNKRNGSIYTLQTKMETTSQWLDDAITSAKRKIVEGTSVPIQDVKKAKTITFKRDDGAPLSPIRDKENSPNVHGAASAGAATPKDDERLRIRMKPPPSAVKRKVDGMRVVDLKKELKSKGIDQKGLKKKKEFQERLLQAYTTVEKILSPAKPPANKKTSPEIVEKMEPTTEKAEDQHSDSESVEVIVFSTSEDEQQAMQVEGEIPPTEDTTPIQQDSTTKEAEQEYEDIQMEETQKEDATNPSEEHHPPPSPEAMSIEPAPPVEAPVPRSEERNDAPPKEKKRFSMVNRASLGEKRNLDGALPKVTMSVDPSTSRSSNAAVKKEGQQSPKAKQKLGVGSSRKVSQESTSATSVESNQSASSKKSAAAPTAPTSAAKPATSNQAKETTKSNGPRKDSQGNSSPPRAQSPIRRVQAAIQMFTAKSASKPASKPMTTPSKLAWLNKGQQYPQKSTTDTAASQNAKHEPPKAQHQVQPKTDKLAMKAVRRPGMGQPTNNASSSALKPNRLLTKGNPNTAAEARKARIAELREKSKPVAKPVFATTKDLPVATASLSSMKNKAAGNSAEEKESKRKLLTAQMREKAAARKQLEMAAKETKAAAAAGKQADEKAAPKQQSTSAIKAPKEPAAPKGPVEQAAQPMSSAKPKTPSSVKDQDYLAGLRPQLLSPMDTYEISDREDSDSESESESEEEDEQNPRKKIPDWALRANLLPALEKQFAEGADRCDPDEIFAEVKTCDLQAIFNNKRSKYVRRTSSGNWTKDKVTAVEKLTYKRAMGYGGSRK